MKPIGLDQIVNYGFISTFIWYGADKKDSAKNSWARVSEAIQVRGARNRTSVWFSNEEIEYNGLTIKWCERKVSSVHLIPQVVLFTGFSETEMPKDSFLVIQAKVMFVSGNIDARNKSVGYITMLMSKQKMGHFFEYHYTKMGFPCFQIMLTDCTYIPVD